MAEILENSVVTPPSTFPQKQESVGRARWLVVRRGLPRYEKKIAESRAAGKQKDRSKGPELRFGGQAGTE
jgi:hypothetical protein